MSARMAEVEVASAGLLSVIVCAPAGMPVADVAAAASIIHPTGITSPWGPPDGGYTEATAPLPCADHPGTRLHHYFEC
jgi:hypothetical protein